jgi:hypothetical protein
MTTVSGAGTRIGRYRWVICALLFFATTINYIDRQVLGILAPDLQKEIGWSELDYGRIVIAFQISYAVMMLVWGRILDRVGTKLGLGLAVAWWSVAAMSTALARSAMGFGLARFFLGRRRGGELPGLDQDGGRMVSEKRAGVRDGHFQRRHEHRRDRGAHRRADTGSLLRLAGGVHLDWRDRLLLADCLVHVLSPAVEASPRD